MPVQRFDLVAIGGGSAGLVSAAVAAGLGARAALIERARLGGECLWTGCVPSKGLLHAARVAHLARHADAAGLVLPPPGPHAAAGVLAAVRALREEVRQADGVEPLLAGLGVTFLYGSGRFVAPRVFLLGETEIRARHFVLATGSRPAVPPLPGLAETGYLTNVTFFERERLPESLVVLGGGPVGAELAQACARLGTRVVLIGRSPRLLPREDPELTAFLARRLQREGVALHLGAEAVAVQRTETGRRVFFRSPGAEPGTEQAVEAEEVLVATGRLPNVEGLGLEELGLRCGPAGVPVDDCLRTPVPGLWACGDVAGWPQFSHMAEQEAKAVVRNALLPFPRRYRREQAAWATFTDPELASAGLTEAQARQRGYRVEVFRHPFAQDDRALADREAHGVVKLVARAGSGRLLGGQILGPRAGELIQEVILALERGWSVRHLADAVHVYPTLAVAVQRAAQYWWQARGEEPAARLALRAARWLRARWERE